MKIIKKNGKIEEFDGSKIVNAIKKSADRVMVSCTEDENNLVVNGVLEKIRDRECVKVSELHNLVELSLMNVNPTVGQAYKHYRDYKKSFVGMLDDVYNKSLSIRYRGDKENSNTDSTLVSTKRSLIYNELNTHFYEKFFLSEEEKLAHQIGYIYIHDKSARLDTMNCCLFDSQNVMRGGFEMGNMWYNEPNTVDVACHVLGDIIMMSASMQYGGWSTRIDNLLAPYAEKSYKLYKEELLSYGLDEEVAEEKALNKTRRDLEQGAQGLEYKLNSVASSRGDYPFTTFALGLGTNRFELMVSKAFLDVRRKGQGKKGKLDRLNYLLLDSSISCN